jgi:hypothetical protein
MYNPSGKKNGDYTSPKIEVILLDSPDIVTTSSPFYNGNIDSDGWT